MAPTTAVIREKYPITDDAVGIAIAAIGDQLAVAWLDTAGQVRFQRLAFALDAP